MVNHLNKLTTGDSPRNTNKLALYYMKKFSELIPKKIGAMLDPDQLNMVMRKFANTHWMNPNTYNHCIEVLSKIYGDYSGIQMIHFCQSLGIAGLRQADVRLKHSYIFRRFWIHASRKFLRKRAIFHTTSWEELLKCTPT